MRILVLCEESQAVTKELRLLGHEAFSCDLLPCSGGHPEWHYQKDAFEVVKLGWDKIISFPPCTHLTLSGAKHFAKKRESGVQEEGLRFFFEIWKISDCTENPMGIINGGKYIKEWFPELHKEMTEAGFPFKPTQVIQPYEFGDPVRKTTCLWNKTFPNLIPTNNVENEVKYYISAKGDKMSEFHAKQLVIDGKKYGYHTPEFKKHRSVTFPGIAKAIAEQWAGKIN